VEVVTGFLRSLVVALALVAGAGSALAQQQASEAAVKAALLYKFVSYVEWPAEAGGASAPFVIGVVAAEEVAAELEQLARGRPINNRPVTVRRLKEGELPAGLHMLFHGGREIARIRTAAAASSPVSVLLVSDVAGGLEAGAVINFVSVDDRVGFEVSVAAAERSSLRVSSRMLGVARRVVAGNP
jgi:hypothetical protein